MGAGPLINLHTHTRFSDGDFKPEDLVERAAVDGLSHLAITDHFATLKVRSLDPGGLEGYLRLLRGLRRKNKNGLTVLAGVEVDTNPSRCNLWRLPFDQLNRLDLVLFEYLCDPLAGGIGLKEFEELRSQLTVPCGLAHTDISRVFSHLTPEELADLLSSMDVFVEVNTAHLYARDGGHYFELAEDHYRAFRRKVKVSVGTDTHHQLPEVSNLGLAYRFLRRVGLLEDLLF